MHCFKEFSMELGAQSQLMRCFCAYPAIMRDSEYLERWREIRVMRLPPKGGNSLISWLS